MKKIYVLFLLIIAAATVKAQNISVNTTGAANSTLSMLEVLQISTTANTKGLHIAHSGAITGTGYGFWIEKTGASTTNIAGYFTASGATNNYALIVPSAGGSVGIGTTTPVSKLDVEGGVSIGVTYSGTTAAPTNGVIIEGNVGIGQSSPPTNAKLAIRNGHLQISQTTAPTVAAHANAGTGASASLSASSNDVAGAITLTSGTSAFGTGTQATVTFNRSYTTAPIVILTPTNATAAGSNKEWYPTSTTTTFTISTGQVMSGPFTYVFNYLIIEP